VEKITVRIGCIGKNSNARNVPAQTETNKIEFLRKCFKISHRRAQLLIKELDKQNKDKYSVSLYLILTLNYEQLARYTVFRQVDGLNTFWKYPHVLDIIEEDNQNPEPVIELRPSYRKLDN